jgi:predicted RNA-binding Zn-ribbon protein involved in translation (DUF1610 family)
MSFEIILEEDMNKVLTDFEQKEAFQNAKEKVYFKTLDETIQILIFSTIAYKGISRNYGEDAIRVKLYDSKNKRVFGKSTHTKRTTGWEKRLLKKITDIENQYSEYKRCPKCGSVMVEREAKTGKYKGNKFYGCIGFPNCNYMENINGVENKPEKECPNCGKELKRRLANSGPNAGKHFWGCSGFPNCRYTENE